MTSKVTRHLTNRQWERVRPHLVHQWEGQVQTLGYKDWNSHFTTAIPNHLWWYFSFTWRFGLKLKSFIFKLQTSEGKIYHVNLDSCHPSLAPPKAAGGPPSSSPPTDLCNKGSVEVESMNVWSDTPWRSVSAAIKRCSKYSSQNYITLYLPYHLILKYTYYTMKTLPPKA